MSAMGARQSFGLRITVGQVFQARQRRNPTEAMRLFYLESTLTYAMNVLNRC
jgi:hypothetical protein